jgi:S-adenosyl methyltransferase
VSYDPTTPAPPGLAVGTANPGGRDSYQDQQPGADEPFDPRTRQFDPAVPHPARIYAYWLGSKDHYPADRKAAEEVAACRPQVVAGARANRAFLARSVRYMAGQRGISQFLDIGPGLPAPCATHEVAQAIAPESRVVCVDSDPLVLSHARALLTSSRQGACEYVGADLRDPETIVKEAGRVLDFTQPAAVILAAVLHFLADADDPGGLVAALTAPLAPGSFIVISHLTADFAPDQVASGVAAYNALVPAGITARTTARSRHCSAGFHWCRRVWSRSANGGPITPRCAASAPTSTPGWPPCGGHGDRRSAGPGRDHPGHAGRRHLVQQPGLRAGGPGRAGDRHVRHPQRPRRRLPRPRCLVARVLGTVLPAVRHLLGAGPPGRREVPAGPGGHRRPPSRRAADWGPGVTPAHRPALGRMTPSGTDGDAQRWREAAQLRTEHRGWIVIWLASGNCFKAYRRLPGARRDTAISAATRAEMADLIGQAEQAAAARPARRARGPR